VTGFSVPKIEVDSTEEIFLIEDSPNTKMTHFLEVKSCSRVDISNVSDKPDTFNFRIHK
jgi:hypothetical protein